MTAVLIITIELLVGRPPFLPESHTAALCLACQRKAFGECVLIWRILTEFLAPFSHIHESRDVLLIW